ncbi:unnamed protein product [Schistocephalus solidus]|uniref:Doublecortin domain-containing protein n=1 Tax=Schistocephalus solidus TaxID=70667 RepID=A0A183SEC6_SCHSO|nr:unnamed protein product [Schistocephalus solidus]
MPSKTPATANKPKHNQKSNKAPKTVFGHALVTGYVPIPKSQEITIDNALEAVQSVSKRSTRKPYKCKVGDSITYLVVRRRNVVNSTKPWKLRIPYLEIFHYFIFTHDPTLVVLVIPEKTSGYLAYLMLNMETPEQAAAICDAIQKRRRSMFGDKNTADNRATQKTDAQSSTTADGWLEYDHPEGYSDSVSAERCEEEGPRNATVTPTRLEGQRSAAPNGGNETKDESLVWRADAEGVRVSSETAQTDFEKGPDLLEALIEPRNKQLQNSALPFMYDSEGSEERSNDSDSESDEETQKEADLRKERTKEEEIRSHELPRHNVSTISSGVQSGARLARRQPPRIEEMSVSFLGSLDENLRDDVRGMDALRKSLLANKYDEDWAFEVKVIKSEGNYCSRISEEGNVFMFAAHHLVPENYCRDRSMDGDSGTESDLYIANRRKSEKSKKPVDSSDSACMLPSPSSSASSSSSNQISERNSAHSALADDSRMSSLPT